MTNLILEIAPVQPSTAEPTDADRAWLAYQSGDWHAEEPTPLDVLGDSAPFDDDAPVIERDLDALHAERCAESDVFGTFGHPAYEL